MPIQLTKENILSLEKKADFQINRLGLDGQVAEVELVLDISGSMHGLYRDNTVQNVIARILPLGMKFDDNGAIGVTLFGTNAYRMPDVTLENVIDYVPREVLSKHSINEGTYYAKALQQMFPAQNVGAVAKNLFSRFTGGKQVETVAKKDIAKFVIFVTDGAPSDQYEAERLLRELSKYPVFIQFVGIGGASFNFLENLNTLQGREIDNAGFMAVPDINAKNDTQLYSELLNEFPQYLKEAKAKNIIN